MRLSHKTSDPIQAKLDVLIAPLAEGDTPPQVLDEHVGGSAQRAVRLGDFRGALQQTSLHYGKGKGPKRVILVGLGPRDQVSLEHLRRALGRATATAAALGATKLGIAVPGKLPVDRDDAAGACAEGAALAAYRWSAKSEEQAKPVEAIQVFAPKPAKAAIQLAAAVAEGVALARDLGNAPGNLGTPSALAAAARKAGKQAGFEVKVLLPADLERLGMGGLLGVAKGSAEPPRFIQMEYAPKGAKGGPICLVGKGLTFDSGGISIKPAQGMEEMKFDKCGGCAVIGTLYAVAKAKLPVRLIGLVPSTENMPGAAANKPGDVLTALNGKTIEVQNTDAEGRLILADALAYSARFKPQILLDFATLTYGVIAALGKERAGVMSDDQALIGALRSAGHTSGELLWPLPMDAAYGEHVRSQVADVRNMGRPKECSSIAAGWFLKHFVPEGPRWAHVDIAGTAWHTRDPGLGHTGIGASGFGVRLSVQFLRDYLQTTATSKAEAKETKAKSKTKSKSKSKGKKKA